MSSSDTIGGYFELELNLKDEFLHHDAIFLNSGRNCLEYILEAENAKKIYLPRYTCDVVLEPVKKLSISYDFYSINENLEITENIILGENEYLLYTNYFGIKDEYTKILINKYNNKIIVDCSQALFFRSDSGNIFYSPRKFVGVSDGGILYSNKLLNRTIQKDVSINRFSHLIKRIDLGAEAAYCDFKTNDASLSNQPIMHMSNLTKSIYSSVDFDKIVEKRKINYDYLYNEFADRNLIKLPASNNISCPMYYPFLSNRNNLRDELVKNKIFTPLYWPNVLMDNNPSSQEYQLAEKLVLIPIDQRYDMSDMKRIASILNEG